MDDKWTAALTAAFCLGVIAALVAASVLVPRYGDGWIRPAAVGLSVFAGVLAVIAWRRE
jgi:hypothetical protein